MCIRYFLYLPPMSLFLFIQKCGFWAPDVTLFTLFSRDSDLRNSSRDGDMLQRYVDMYEHIHIFSQHIHIFRGQYEHIHIFCQHIHSSKDVDMVKRDVDMFTSLKLVTLGSLSCYYLTSLLLVSFC